MRGGFAGILTARFIAEMADMDEVLVSARLYRYLKATGERDPEDLSPNELYQLIGKWHENDEYEKSRDDIDAHIYV